VFENEDWGRRAQKGFLASGIDPGDRRGHKNNYIDLLQKTALEEVLDLKGDEIVLDFGCGSGRMSYWIAPRVKRVLGLEVTSEMIDLAELNRASENVEFRLYDGAHFPVFPDPFDLILSVGRSVARNRLPTGIHLKKRREDGFDRAGIRPSESRPPQGGGVSRCLQEVRHGLPRALPHPARSLVAALFDPLRDYPPNFFPKDFEE
jgi:SAM-dependent methyltransferase